MAVGTAAAVAVAAAVGYDKREGSVVVQRLQKVAILGKERTTEAGEWELEDVGAIAAVVEGAALMTAAAAGNNGRRWRE